jgi:hypothetical protein
VSAVAVASEVEIYAGILRAPAVLDGHGIVDKDRIYVPAVFYLPDPGVAEKPGNFTPVQGNRVGPVRSRPTVFAGKKGIILRQRLNRDIQPRLTAGTA